MRVMFARSDDGRLCSWRAELAGHRQVRGPTKAGPDLEAMPRVRRAPARRRVRR